MDLYGAYKHARDASWQCLLDFEITTLPVDLSAIARASGISLRKNSAMRVLSNEESGASILREQSWYLIYDDDCNDGRQRFTIAHELGHIFLGHQLVRGRYGRTFRADKPLDETEADMFAARLLAPACMLWALDLHTAEEIAHICRISNEAATIRAERMKLLYDRNKFLVSPLEKRVLDQFSGFISVQKSKPRL